MKALITIIFSFVLISPVYVITVWFGPPPLFTCGIKEISDMEIVYYGSDYGITDGRHSRLRMTHDKTAIYELCRTISAMKLESYEYPREYESQESDPAFTITINYRNKKSDVLIGTNSWIYRPWGDNGGWVGGRNPVARTSVENLINSGKYKTGN